MVVAGKGKVLIKRRDGQHSFTSDVLYFPGMKSTLLNLGELLEKGYAMAMEEKVLKAYDSNKHLILKAPLAKNKIFKVGFEMLEYKCLATVVNQEEWLWHYRFRHLNFKDLTKLQNK